MDIKFLLQNPGSESLPIQQSIPPVASATTGTKKKITATSACIASSLRAGSSPHANGLRSDATALFGFSPRCPPQASRSASSEVPEMMDVPALPAISELQRDPDPSTHPQFRSLHAEPPGSGPVHHDQPGSNRSPPHQAVKRRASQTSLPDESPAKKQSKWTPEEDDLTIELRGQGMKWDDVAKRLPGRSSISCRLRYQNYLEKRALWDEEKKNKLARLYARFKDQMWQKVATEMGIPWRSAESTHWQLGEQEMSARANAPVFQLHPSATSSSSPSQSNAVPAPVLAPTSHGFTIANAAPVLPNPPPVPAQQYRAAPPPQPPGPMHSTHQRANNGSSQNGRRNYTSSRQRADTLPRTSIPSQHSQSKPRIQPSLAEGVTNGVQAAAPGPERQTYNKREAFGTIEPYQERRKDVATGPVAPDPDGQSQSCATRSSNGLQYNFGEQESPAMNALSLLPYPTAA